jgi:hypothetical protein
MQLLNLRSDSDLRCSRHQLPYFAPSHPAASAANQAELFTMRARGAVAARDYGELPCVYRKPHPS